MTVRVTASARSDLRSIIETIAIENPAAAKRVRRRLWSVVDSLGAQPERGGLVGIVAGRTLRRLVSSPYLVFYALDSGAAVIVRVLHGARDVDRELDANPGWPDTP